MHTRNIESCVWGSKDGQSLEGYFQTKGCRPCLPAGGVVGDGETTKG